MTKDLETHLQELEAAEKEILDVGLGIMKAYGGALYPLDFLVSAVLKRSLALISGFATLIRAKNFTSAGALVRLHLDNVLRFSAATLVRDPHAFAGAVLNGGHVRKLKDKNGQLMTDAYLVRCLSGDHPWVARVYDETSGYIHLSRKHIFNAYGSGDNPSDGRFVIGKEDEFIPDTLRIEAALAMQAITNLLLAYLHAWRETKDNPSEDSNTSNEEGA